MAKSDVSFASAVESRTRGIYVELLRENPSLTLGELRDLCRGELGKALSTITLGELAVAGKPAKREVTSAKKSTSKAPTKPAKPATKKAAQAKGTSSEADKDPAEPKKPAEVNTKTPAGREAFDATVFAAIQSIAGPAGAGPIQKLTGGTNMQVRSACNRLIEAGRVSWSGKARGTRYQVV